MNNNKYCIILAGGAGTRFWPLSRIGRPKQFLDILGRGKSFIRDTYERFLPLIPSENFIVVTNFRYRELVLESIPELKAEQILCEPVGRNTAASIAYAAFHLQAKDPDAQMVITPSDHHITEKEKFEKAIAQCLQFIEQKPNALMTIGVKPTRAECSYGYIQSKDNEQISSVKSFTEKPNAELAKTFVESGEFLWNSGIFIWRAEAIIDAIQLHLPEHHTLFSSIADSYRTDKEQELIDEIFAQTRAISIDYGVMERSSNVYVFRSDFSWCDVETWGSLDHFAEQDKDGNSSFAKSYLFDTHNTIISSKAGKIVVASGLEDYMVIDTDDVLFIAPKSDEQNIKKFVDEIKYKKGEKFI